MNKKNKNKENIEWIQNHLKNNFEHGFSFIQSNRIDTIKIAKQIADKEIQENKNGL